jgi:hypothetical protein
LQVFAQKAAMQLLRATASQRIFEIKCLRAMLSHCLQSGAAVHEEWLQQAEGKEGRCQVRRFCAHEQTAA